MSFETCAGMEQKECRALVAAEQAPDRGSSAYPRRGNPGQAALAAQLIACKLRLEDFRDRRRAAPDVATARYQAGADVTRPAASMQLDRAV